MISETTVIANYTVDDCRSRLKALCQDDDFQIKFHLTLIGIPIDNYRGRMILTTFKEEMDIE